MDCTLVLTTADCNSGLSIVWPLGSPILPVAPPTYNDIKYEQYTCRANFTHHKVCKFTVGPEQEGKKPFKRVLN